MKFPRLVSQTLLSCFVLGELLMPITANAFIYIRGGRFSKGSRPISSAPVWDDRVVKFKVNTNLSAYSGTETLKVTSAEFLSAVELAINAWAGACRSDLSVKFDSVTSLIADANDGVNVISYDNRSSASNTFGNDQNILAAATTVLSGNSFFDCDIVVNGNALADIGVDSGSLGTTKYDLVSILAHEIGHCLGLDHPVEPPDYDLSGTDGEKKTTLLYNATMVQSAIFGPGDTRRRDINQDDKDGIDCIYERGRPFRTGSHCASYHGTNGGAAISGVISGGPTSDRGNICSSEGDGRTVEGKENETAPGCVGSAVAAPKEKKISRSLYSPFDLWSFILVFLAYRLLSKRSRPET